MNGAKQIMSILSAMGATPSAETDKNGNTLIKVNAPTVTTQKEKENEK